MEDSAVPSPSDAIDDTGERQATQPLSQDPESDAWGTLEPYDRTQARVNFKAHSLTLGRHASNDVVLKSSTISRRHCKIEWGETNARTPLVTIIDLSQNGTYINGYKIIPGRHDTLVDGAVITFGVAPSKGKDIQYIFRLSSFSGPNHQYEILHALGRSASGTVLKALGKEDGKPYAIRRIEPCETAQSGPRSQSMPPVLEKLVHENICQYLEIFYEGGEISLVMEWVPGGDLHQYMLTHGTISEEVCRHITFQICSAMAYIHSKGIEHNDLKPENILVVSMAKNRLKAKVGDFGLLRDKTKSTVPDSHCRNWLYMANGERKGEGHRGAVDSWTLGIMIFEMLTQFERGLDWDHLKEKVLRVGEEFIRELLEREQARRLTMTNALNHSWIRRIHNNGARPYIPKLDAPQRENAKELCRLLIH